MSRRHMPRHTTGDHRAVVWVWETFLAGEPTAILVTTLAFGFALWAVLIAGAS